MVVLIFTIIGTCYDVKKHNLAKNMVAGQRPKKISENERLGLATGNYVKLIFKLFKKNNLVSQAQLVSSNSSLESNTSKPNLICEIIKCFSVYSNIKNVVRTDLPPDSIPVIHGLKFFGMLWIILVHSVFYQADYMENVPMAYRLSEDIFAQILSNSTYCVDTFLFIR